MVEKVMQVSLFIATLGAFYVMVVTVVFQDKSFAGFFNSWQFPMIFAVFVDASYYRHIRALAA
jgi:hypothetical protein